MIGRFTVFRRGSAQASIRHDEIIDGIDGIDDPRTSVESGNCRRCESDHVTADSYHCCCRRLVAMTRLIDPPLPDLSVLVLASSSHR